MKRMVCVAALLALIASTARADHKPLRVAVMDFTAAGTSAEFAALGAGLQSMVTTDLGELPAFVLVERARLKDIQAEIKLAQDGVVDKTTAAQIGALAGATHLLVGTFTVVGGKMRIDARLFVVGSGEVVLAEKIEGAQTTFFDLEKQLVKRIVDTVGVKLSRKEKGDLKNETTDFEAFTKYSQGLVLGDQHKVAEAVVAMQAAVTRDPNFTLAVTQLGDMQKLLASLPPPNAPKPAQCKNNPMFTPQCNPDGSPPTPSAPMIFTGDGNRSFSMVVRANGNEARCVTPCQLHLPEGPVDLEVVSPVQYNKVLNIPAGPSQIVVAGRNKTNLIIGVSLGAVSVAALVATLGLAFSPLTSTANTNEYSPHDLYPLTLAIATGAAFPAVLYLLQIGKNQASVVRSGFSTATATTTRPRLTGVALVPTGTGGASSVTFSF